MRKRPTVKICFPPYLSATLNPLALSGKGRYASRQNPAMMDYDRWAMVTKFRGPLMDEILQILNPQGIGLIPNPVKDAQDPLLDILGPVQKRCLAMNKGPDSSSSDRTVRTRRRR